MVDFTGKPDFVFDDTPGWNYFVAEVFVNTYKVRAVHETGRMIEVTGFNEIELVERLHQEVLQILAVSKNI
jgi:hypothetical protein